jgi:predicted flap endonuclease-1-like 5' DNA nuclease
MKNISSEQQRELERLKIAYKSAKDARKLARDAYKAQLKALKAQIKTFKLALKQAEKAEKQAKVAYRAFEKEIKGKEGKTNLEEILERLPEIATPAEVKENMKPEKKRRKLKASQREEEAVPTTETGETPVKAKRGPKPKAVKPEITAPAKRGRKKAVVEGDELTKIVGVGKKVADMLIANGIRTYAQMAATSVDRYKTLLQANRMSQFRNPSTWAEQAAALANAPKPVVAESTPAQPARQGRKTKTAPAAEEAPAKAKRGPKPKAVKTEPAAPVKKGRKKAVAIETAAVKEPSLVATSDSEAPAAKKIRRKPAVIVYDDLTQIDGVGDKVAIALNEAGITSFEDMAATSVERFREILQAKKMSRYRNPSNWSSEAAELAKKR